MEMFRNVVVAVIIVASVVGFIWIGGCSRPDQARHLLEEQGYKNIVITGWSPFSCSDSDNFSTGFTATNGNGAQVRGVVCSGLLKSATIRFN